MSAFTGPLAIAEQDADSDWWMLITPLVWEVGALGSGVFITVEDGFTTDGASIPWPIVDFFPRWGRKYRRPSILHDRLLTWIDDGTPHPNAPTRAAADRVFLEAMAACHVWWSVRWAFYFAVRIGALWSR